MLFDVWTDRERDCFLLYAAENKSMGEVAEALDISKASVQTYIKRAKEKEAIGFVIILSYEVRQVRWNYFRHLLINTTNYPIIYIIYQEVVSVIAFLGVMSLFVFIIFGIMSVMSFVRKKGTLKRNALITVISFVFAVFLMAVDPSDNDTEIVEDNGDDKQENVEVKEEEVVKEETEKKTDIKDEEEKKEEEKKEQKEDEEDLSWDDLKDKDMIVGKSDKDFSNISKSKPTDVRNDKTGNWRKSTLSEDIDIEEYALSYNETHMKEDEVHHIINFTRNTTTWLNKMNGLLYIDIKERVDKEEHDASTLGSGMILKSYVIYPDGDIQELED